MSKRPVVLVVMDGVGISNSEFGNAVKAAYKPTLDNLWETCPHTEIKAHGLAAVSYTHLIRAGFVQILSASSSLDTLRVFT